jgi:hypothetical protein
MDPLAISTRESSIVPYNKLIVSENAEKSLNHSSLQGFFIDRRPNRIPTHPIMVGLSQVPLMTNMSLVEQEYNF